MDAPIDKKSSNFKKISLAAVGVVLMSLFMWYWLRQKKTFNLSKDEVQISTVMQGNFEDMLMITAQTQSLHSSLVNVLEGGVLKEIYVEDGQMVKQNQPLARVYNPNTELNYLNQEATIAQQISQMQSALIALKSQAFNQNKEWLQTQNDYTVAQQQYQFQKRLFDAEIGRKNDYDMALQTLQYEEKRKAVIEKSMENETQARIKQNADIQYSISQMQKSMEVLRQNKNNFLILAPASGRLSSFSISLGENLTNGQNIGKIDVMDGYKLIAKIDEYYLNKLHPGIKGSLESQDKSFVVFVSKVLPEVKNGQFTAEINFEGKQTPPNLTIGMTFGVKLKFSQDTKSLLVSKGNFYTDTGGKWIFVLNGTQAEKREISIGRENNLYYEITSGLNHGDKVITSDYSKFKNYEILNIK